MLWCSETLRPLCTLYNFVNTFLPFVFVLEKVSSCVHIVRAFCSSVTAQCKKAARVI